MQVFSLPYLLASKIEAFLDRGRGDFLDSRDMEDIITLLDGCLYFREEMEKAPKEVRDYLIEKFRVFLANSNFIDSLQGHIEAVQPRTGRAERLEALLKELTQ